MLVNGKDDIPYMKWKIKHVWNHQPDIYSYSLSLVYHIYEHKQKHILFWICIYIYKYFNILTRFLKQIMAVTRTATVTPTAVVRCRRAAIHRSALPRKPWVRLGAVARGEGHLTQFQETLLRLHANDPSVFQGNKEGKDNEEELLW